MILSLKAKENLPEVQCLQPREACANPQVDFLPSPHCLGQVSIGCRQVLHCMLYVFFGQCGEMCPLHMQAAVDCLAYVDDLNIWLIWKRKVLHRKLWPRPRDRNPARESARLHPSHDIRRF